MSRSSTLIVLFLSCKNIVISGFLQQIFLKKTENGRSISHLLTWINAQAHQGCEFNNEIILLNVIIFSYTCNVPPWNQIYNFTPLNCTFYKGHKSLWERKYMLNNGVFFIKKLTSSFTKYEAEISPCRAVLDSSWSMDVVPIFTEKLGSTSVRLRFALWSTQLKKKLLTGLAAISTYTSNQCLNAQFQMKNF